ncbi:MAG: 1-acyl-sn-glycerol-3-phosphate acyltransferase [Rubricella sp.]
MTSTIELPLWLVIAGGIALAIMVIQRALVPPVRWFFRRRLSRAFDEINARLQLPIQPFAMTRRRVLVDRLTYDPAVMQAVEERAREEGIPREFVADQAARYAREIVPYFSPTAYFGLGTRLSRWIAQSLYRVRLGTVDEAALDTIDPEATVVFIMNHRSNMDYLLVTYLAAERSALSYAAGEWARVWPLEQIAKAMGAFFIRRRSLNPLYRRVLARYVQMATEGGVTQAVFPEGGLSRNGHLGEPKLGMLSYLLEGHGPERRDVAFVPVGLNYDRVLEDRVLINHERGPDGRPRFRASIFKSIRFALHLLWLRLRGRFHRFGYASVSFGRPIVLSRFVEEHGSDVERLGSALMAEVGRVVPILPVPLIARVFLDLDGEPIARDALEERAAALRDVLLSSGAHMHLPRHDFSYAVECGLRLLVERHLVVEGENGLSASADALPLLTYYAASIAHLGPDAPQHSAAMQNSA